MIDAASDQGEWETWLDNAWKDTGGGYLTLAQLLTLEAHGNHDNHSPLFYGNVVLPQDIPSYPQYAELFFSFDVGPVHVVVMDDTAIGEPMVDMSYQPTLTAWLDADLTAANANRTNVPWVITMHHKPEYSSSTHGMEMDVLLGRAYFAPLWQKYHVDMAFAGHDHDYERSQVLTVGSDVNNPTPGTNATMGTTYVVCAGCGADGYGSHTSPFTAISKDYLAGGNLIGFYGILTADPHNLTLTSHYLATDGTDPVIDTYTITK
jgi:hypothetical protein